MKSMLINSRQGFLVDYYRVLLAQFRYVFILAELLVVLHNLGADIGPLGRTFLKLLAYIANIGETFQWLYLNSLCFEHQGIYVVVLAQGKQALVHTNLNTVLVELLANCLNPQGIVLLRLQQLLIFQHRLLDQLQLELVYRLFLQLHTCHVTSLLFLRHTIKVDFSSF